MALIMTVEELIEELRKCPQNYKVFGYDSCGSIVRLGEGLGSIEIYPNEEEVWI